MGASQQKKTRQQLREEGNERRQVANKKATQKQRKEKRRWTIISIIVGVLILAVILLNSNLFYNSFTAVKIGDVSYTASECNFFYKSSYHSFISNNSYFLQYIGLDTSKNLAAQAYSDEMSWKDYFKETALTQMEAVTMLWVEAQAEGFTLTEEQEAELQESLDALAQAGTSYGYASTDAYLSSVYGKGLDFERVSKLIERSYIAEKYEASVMVSFSYSADELATQYKENADNYDMYSYLSATISGAADEENNIDSETAMAAAKATAEKILAADAQDKADAADAFKQTVLAVTESEAMAETKAGANLTTTYADWLKDPARQEGDTTLIEGDSGYTVLYFLSRSDNNYNTVDVRHILIKAVASEDGTYTDEAKNAALTKLKEIQTEWEAGAKTQASFAELANAKSEDPGSNTVGGLYENVYKNQMVDTFNDFIFGEGRKPGDTGIVFNASSTGYHLIYFVGDGDNYRDVLADNALRSADYAAWKEAKLESYPVTKGFTDFFVK